MTATLSSPRAPAPSPSPPARRTGRAPAQALLGWLYALPTAAFVLLLFVVPLVLVLVMSVSRWPLLTGFRGLNPPDNFTKVVDNRFLLDSIVFTLTYTALATVLLIGLGLGLALLVQEATRWNTVLRTAILVPGALGLASASLLFYVFYSPVAGPFAAQMNEWGISFLGTPNSALASTLFLIVWRFAGFYMLLMLVGLQAIPTEVVEAARMDGASALQAFRHVTLPLLRPTLALTTIMCVTGSLLAFEQFYILTKGGPDNSTISVVQLIYTIAFQGQNDLGAAAALSVCALAVLVVLNIAQLRAFADSDAR